MRVAIVGAGMTGCLLAHHLIEKGHQVTVFEKSRGRGGRCSHKRTDWGEFDMGASVIPGSDADFVSFMAKQVELGLAARWPEQRWEFTDELTPKQEPEHAVGQREYFLFNGGMSSVCHQWLPDKNLNTQSKISCFEHSTRGWRLCNDKNSWFEYFDKVVITAPWPQTAALLNAWAQTAGKHVSLPEQTWTSCCTLAIELANPIETEAELIYMHQSPLQLLSKESAKPGTSLRRQVWVAHFTNAYSDANSDKTPEALLEIALAEISRVFYNVSLSATNYYHHFWRYARPTAEQFPIGILSLADDTLIAGGDWSFGSSVQAAFLASNALAEQIEVVRD